jgi:hypothetical protein
MTVNNLISISNENDDVQDVEEQEKFNSCLIQLPVSMSLMSSTQQQPKNDTILLLKNSIDEEAVEEVDVKKEIEALEEKEEEEEEEEETKNINNTTTQINTAINADNIISSQKKIIIDDNIYLGELNLDDTIEELNLDNTPETLETINIKNPKEIYYKMYKEAKNKAKELKEKTILAYLDAKNIKKTYLLDLTDENESDSEIEF